MVVLQLTKQVGVGLSQSDGVFSKCHANAVGGGVGANPIMVARILSHNNSVGRVIAL